VAVVVALVVGPRLLPVHRQFQVRRQFQVVRLRLLRRDKAVELRVALQLPARKARRLWT
jgi:hypothetical protein